MQKESPSKAIAKRLRNQTLSWLSLNNRSHKEENWLSVKEEGYKVETQAFVDWKYGMVNINIASECVPQELNPGIYYHIWRINLS